MIYILMVNIAFISQQCWLCIYSIDEICSFYLKTKTKLKIRAGILKY